MSRETLADRYDIKTVWKSASSTIHTTEECYRLNVRSRSNDVPAASIPVGNLDRCPTCWGDLDDPTSPAEIVSDGGESA